MSDEWKQLLASPEYLGRLYDGTPPSPDMCDLFYFHIDERENSVTLGFVTRSFPLNPPEEWDGKGFNAFEFYLVFTGVDGLRVMGWGPAEAKQVDLTVRDGGFIDVTLGAEGPGATFRASSSRLAKVRAYLASDSP
ncbi:Imm50 family immunity protein [Streptomyces sp. NPDC047043]|uniref:Imm50 family immunity protein n=1 Tax=Streptomyces sp. NPDC047043 TaxID=3154497 RepID=UPI0034070D81